MKSDKVVEVAKKLTLENMEQLLYIFKDHISIYFGSSKKMLITGELSKENPVCLNGASIQINAEYTDKNNSFMKQYRKYLKWLK